jgi:hypothetical protein
MSDDRWWEPPLAGTEVEQLLGALERMRATFRWKADDLDAVGLSARVGASTMTIGGLLKHLAAAEDYMFTAKMRGEPIGAPWDALGWDGEDDWSFTWSTEEHTPAELYALWDGATGRSRARVALALADGGLDQPVHIGWGGQHANLRRLVCDLLEEYGRHTGHADLIREAIDGRVGEDPPEGWRPVGARV